MSSVLQSVPAQESVSDAEISQRWLSSLEQALNAKDKAGVAALFAPDDCHWRDVLAFTWFITPHRGAQEIGAALVASQEATKASGFAIAKGRTPPRRIKRAGISVLETIFSFETAFGRGFGVLRLKADKPTEAFQIMTALHELKGFEEHVGHDRPTGEAHSRNFGGMNWKDLRIKAQAYEDREPAVLVVGGGQAGLTVAARLVRLGVDTLVVDKHERAGDCWRKRYHSLALHNYTDFNHLPYMPFPSTWPAYLPKDMIADWFENYVWAMELNYWTSAEFVRGSYDDATGTWNAVVRRGDGTERTLHPRHLILAGGLNGKPSVPSIPGLADFKGAVMHSGEFDTGVNWRGKKALVFGTGNSAHDVAQDLHSHDVDTTIVQRGSTTVVSVNPSAKLIHASALDGTPLEDADLIATTNTYPVMKLNLQTISARMMELDKKLIEDLIACGFKWDMGEDNTGHQMKIRKRSGGYYLNIGCSELIIKGEIGLLQYDQIEKLVAEGALLKDGTVKPADLVVLGTGFQPLETLVRDLLGDKIADKIGRVWGFGPDGEMNNMWKRTAQEGLWIVGSGLAASRQYSRVVALQVKAVEEGLLSKKR